MRTFLLASALVLAAAAPASAQMGGMGGGGGGMRSCVSGGQFVPCPAGGGMMGAQPGMMGAAQPGMAQGEMMEERRPMRRAKRSRMSRRM